MKYIFKVLKKQCLEKKYKEVKKLHKNKIAIILGVVCMLLTISIVVQMRTIEKATNTVGTGISDNSGLKDEFLKNQDEYNTAYKKLEEAEKRLEEVRNQATQNNETDTNIEAEIKEDRKLLGLTEVTGPGFIINLDDNRQINSSEVLNVSDYLVHEGDLTYIINELFNAGADAIAINDQRITSKTSIHCDGNIIRINGEMVSVPITIKAIGYPERLDYALNRPGGYLEILANAGVQVYVQKSEKITLPKYEGVYSSDFLTRGDE